MKSGGTLGGKVDYLEDQLPVVNNGWSKTPLTDRYSVSKWPIHGL